MRVVIKTIDGHKEDMNIELDWTTGHLKNQIEEIIGIPVKNQRLIYQGSPLIDDLSLNRLEEGSIIHLIFQLY